jgi:hypothetical protein
MNATTAEKRQDIVVKRIEISILIWEIRNGDIVKEEYEEFKERKENIFKNIIIVTKSDPDIPRR